MKDARRSDDGQACVKLETGHLGTRGSVYSVHAMYYSTYRGSPRHCRRTPVGAHRFTKSISCFAYLGTFDQNV